MGYFNADNRGSGDRDDDPVPVGGNSRDVMNNGKNFWMGVMGGLVTFILTVIATIFLFGRQVGTLRQELNDVARWKLEAGPRIERMDRGGSISFENFKTTYDLEQAKQYKRLEELEKEVKHIQTIELRIERLEKREP